MELERLLRAVGRRWYVVVALVVAGSAIGLFAERARPLVHVGEAAIVVPADRSTFGSNTVLDRLLLDELGRIESLDLRTQAIGDSPDASVDPAVDMTASREPDSDVITLRVQSSAPSAAVDVVNRWSALAVESIRDRAGASTRNRVIAARARLEDAARELAEADEEITARIESRGEASFASLQTVLLEAPGLDTRQQLAAAQVRTLRSEVNRLEAAADGGSDAEVLSRASLPTTERAGNSLGPAHGALIGFGLALAAIAAVSSGTLTLRSARSISPTVWPTRSNRSVPIERISNELLRHVSRDRIPLVAFSSPEFGAVKGVRQELAAHLAAIGFDVTLLDDSDSIDASGVNSVSRSRIEEVIDLASASGTDLDRSVVFADLADVRPHRSLVESSSVVALVAVSTERHSEIDAAREIAIARSVTSNVLTVVS